MQPNTDIERDLHRILLDKAGEIARDNPNRKIQYDMPSFVEKWLAKYYGQANRNLMKATGLPLEQLGYMMS